MLTINDVTCLSSRLACVLGLLVCPIVGCSDLGIDGGGGQGGTAATGGGAGAGGMAGTGGSGGDPGPETVQMFFTESDASTGLPLEGVEICDVDTGKCTISNEQGKAVLDLPANQEVTLTLEKDGYGRFLGADVTDDTFGGTSIDVFYTDEALAAIADQLGIEYPWKGGVVIFARLPNQTGVTFKPVGATIDAVGEPFYYDAATGLYSWDLEATTAVPQAFSLPLAEGGFVEVPPGVHQFEFGGTAGDCPEPSFGWPGDAPNRLRLPVRDGYQIYGSLRCEGP